MAGVRACHLASMGRWFILYLVLGEHKRPNNMKGKIIHAITNTQVVRE
jgi:hypothetical protein